uniref:CHK kinase-like domain-containing protein n=1 Tax=Pseudictyota dubia TaxID=2749911 RepID=A0A7R9ZE50_9STRA|mmetsp:Transcript_40770/g.75461  ORF Transcript_40770/g.75461 Transcript_40770/m.75461 type:complete len:524 (+) Transcript_40770:85-1656(+)|eukprot:CAMPEP_0197456932 /NCGR_PEP_ID=MMETSP1175-20131217/44679_1 /TAXON_ID=1003142 /ORGANISM="Triceratium dubium, Strain CCMP147" /LENGTH=523 /DNA_ID=CAMNT_0042991145 /DNA_START=82 /DNA_END=1653 /DNA_ORIENTATION=+
MRSFGTEALAILFSVPSSTSFILPSAGRARVVVSSLSRSNDVSVLDTPTEVSSRETTYDPAGVFTNGDPHPFIFEESVPSHSGQSLILDCEDSVDQPDDIIRDLDGDPLSPEYIAQKMGIANVESYICPEKDAFRGFMSNACRVQLLPGGETAFYKRIVFEDLDHAQEKLRHAPFKLVRDAQSCQVVASFLSSKACRSVVEKTGVHIPKCYDAQLRPNHSKPIKSKFSFLLEDLSPSDGWYQQWLLHDIEECKATLSTYAKIHAFFWDGSSFWNDADAAKELEAAVWESGSYVQPEAQSFDQCKIVAKEWAEKRLKFEKELSSFDYWDDLGERLESVAENCGRLAHPFADDTLSESYKKYRTFTHGDPKQANLLFRRSSESTLEVGLIDFQWAGFGLAASDIAHFITSAVHADRLVDGGEEILLRYYFDELQKYLVEFGAFDTVEDARKGFSFSTFMDQYEVATLDICRLMIAYTWSRFKEPVEREDKEGCARTMNKTSYNKSIPNIVWLLSRCDEIMKSRGV